MRLHPFDLTLADVRVHFACDHRELAEYAGAHLGPLLHPGETLPADVTARLRWHEGHPPVDPAAAYPDLRALERVDRDLYIGVGRALWLRVDDARDLHLRFEWDGSRLHVDGDYYHRLSTRAGSDRVRRLVFRRQLGALRRKRFTRLLYYLVYYPAFWWAERVRGLHPIHAGAVDTPAGALVLAGPSGVGKSTLTVALATTAGAAMLSDTFVLHDGPVIWGVPEPVLLDAWSRAWLGEAAQRLSHVPTHRYALHRTGHVAPSDRLRAQARATVVVLPRRAPTRVVREISGQDAILRIDAYDDIVNDLRRYRAFAAVLELLAPVGLSRARWQSLERLAASTRCFEIGLTADMTRDEAIDLLRSVQHGNPETGVPDTAARPR